MEIVITIEKLKTLTQQYRLKKKTIGFVPTMGNLHQGHLSLINKAKQETDICVVSIFVNPTQFDNKEDLKKYPHTLLKDINLLKTCPCDILFVPTVEDVYPKYPKIQFDFGEIERVLEGKYRKGHFNGVALIVSKLLHWVNPNKAFFGQKDLQQVRIVSILVKDLSFPVEIVICATVREASGLAMSSRNNRLTDEDKRKASFLYQGLQKAKELRKKNHDIKKIIVEVTQLIVSQGIKVDYLEIVNSESLKTETPTAINNVVCVAGYIGSVRLIDNIFLN